MWIRSSNLRLMISKTFSCILAHVMLAQYEGNISAPIFWHHSRAQALCPKHPKWTSKSKKPRNICCFGACLTAWRQPVGHCGLPVCCGSGSLKKRLCNLFIVLSGSTLLRNICEEGWGVQDKGLNQSSRTLWCQNGPPNYHTLRQSGPDFKIPLLISHWMQGTRAWG